MSCHEEHATGLILPDQDANLLSVLAGSLELGRRHEFLEQEARRRLHTLALNLPEPDLIDNGGRQDGVILEPHLRVRVRGEEADYLFARDAHADGASDRFTRDLARDHVRVTSREAGEEMQNGDLQGGRCVGVYTIIGFNHDEA